MGKIQKLVCNAFIEKKAKGKKDSFLAYLSPELKKEFLDLPSSCADLTSGFNQVDHLMKWTHYSWFTSFLRTLPESEIPLFLSTFPEETAKKLSKLVLFSAPIPSLSKTAKTFLQKEIIRSLLSDTPDLEPIEALPSSPLNVLLNLSSEEIHLLIEFLGLHDLAGPLRQIIDTTKIKKIQNCLSKEKMFFLTALTQKKQPLLFQQLKLDQWNNEPQSLLDILNKRGMNRFAKALYPENPDFIWHIKHRMNREKAELFSSLHTPLDQPKTYKILTDQVLEIVTFFQKNSIKASL